jgi:hypothetical protein
LETGDKETGDKETRKGGIMEFRLGFSCTNPVLRLELLEMLKRDQEMRTAMREKNGHGVVSENEDRALWKKVDAEHIVRIKEIVHEYGWPGYRLVGKDGSDAAWLLIQHADRDVDFQQKALGLLGQAVKSGDAGPEGLAYLTDRVRMNTGCPQVYGTQFKIKNGQLVLYPLEDPKTVNERRASVGLGRLEDG